MTVPLAAEAVSAPVSARNRRLLGPAASIRQHGYRETKISDIVAHARSSRRTLYEEFDTKAECLLALMHDLNQQMRARIVAAVDPDAPWDEQIRRGVTAWIEAMTNAAQIHRAGLGTVPRERVAILLGGLRELAAMVLEQGDRIESITEPAVAAAMSLLGPGSADPPPRRRRNGLTAGRIRGER